jgi:nucleotide-binding universal stress UspA family protein
VISRTRPILVAVDFSDDSRAALAWASDLAACTGAPLSVIHVVHEPAQKPGYYRRDPDDVVRPMEDVAREMFEDFLEDMRAGLPAVHPLQQAEMILVKGLPSNRILEAAQTIDAQHIVMGCRGHTSLPQLLLGSTADHIAHHAPMPVTVVKAPRAATGDAKTGAAGKND